MLRCMYGLLTINGTDVPGAGLSPSIRPAEEVSVPGGGTCRLLAAERLKSLYAASWFTRLNGKWDSYQSFTMYERRERGDRLSCLFFLQVEGRAGI